MLPWQDDLCPGVWSVGSIGGGRPTSLVLGLTTLGAASTTTTTTTLNGAVLTQQQRTTHLTRHGPGIRHPHSSRSEH